MKSIDIKTIDFTEVGKRVKAYRLMHGITSEQLAEKAHLKESAIINIEEGKRYSTLNQLWAIVGATGVSIPWFFYGKGRFDECSDEDLPETIVWKRGVGIRRTDDRLAAENGQYEGDPFEFVLAVEGFKRFNNKPFPSLTEIFELFMSLGYRKIEQPKINPRKAIQGNRHEHSKSQPNPVGALCKTAGVGG
jgi:transcriptional regulator with XRE-family HTH domain